MTHRCGGSSGVPCSDQQVEKPGPRLHVSSEICHEVKMVEAGGDTLQGVLRLCDLLFNALDLLGIFTQLHFLFNKGPTVRI